MHLEYRKIYRDDVARSSAVGSNVHFESIKMTELQASWTGPDSVDGLEMPFKLQWRTGFEYIPNDDLRIYFFPTIVVHDLNNQPWMQIDAGFRLRYSIHSTPPPPELANELFTSFAAVNGPLNAWPYLRELVDSTTRRMEVPNIFLPLFRVNHLIQDPLSADETSKDPDPTANE